jgi:hypothetical protein
MHCGLQSLARILVAMQPLGPSSQLRRIRFSKIIQIARPSWDRQRGSDLALPVHTTSRVLQAIADRPLVNIRSDDCCQREAALRAK